MTAERPTASQDSAPAGARRRWSLLATGLVLLAVVAGLSVLLLGGRDEPVVDLREIGQLNGAVIAEVNHRLENAPVPVGPDGVPLTGGRAQSSICVPTGSPSTFMCTVQFTDVYRPVLLEVRISDDARRIIDMQERPAY